MVKDISQDAPIYIKNKSNLNYINLSRPIISLKSSVIHKNAEAMQNSFQGKGAKFTPVKQNSKAKVAKLSHK